MGDPYRTAGAVKIWRGTRHFVNLSLVAAAVWTKDEDDPKGSDELSVWLQGEEDCYTLPYADGIKFLEAWFAWSGS